LPGIPEVWAAVLEMKTHFNFKLLPNRDMDLIEWLNSLPAGDVSYFIRQTLRQGLSFQKMGATESPRIDFLKAGKVIIPATPRRGSFGTTPDDLEEKLDRLADCF